jgi:hypothetical protein
LLLLRQSPSVAHLTFGFEVMRPDQAKTPPNAAFKKNSRRERAGFGGMVWEWHPRRKRAHRLDAVRCTSGGHAKQTNTPKFSACHGEGRGQCGRAAAARAFCACLLLLLLLPPPLPAAAAVGAGGAGAVWPL